MDENWEGIVLVRHGLSGDNLSDLLPRKNSLLVEGARKSVRETARCLSGFPLGRIISSPLPRTLETAEILKEALNLRIHVEEDLREMDFGEAAGMSTEEFSLAFPEEAQDILDTLNLRFRWPGGESRGQFFLRSFRGVSRSLYREEPGMDLLVTHWTVSGLVLAYFKRNLRNWTREGLPAAASACVRPGTPVNRK